MQERARRMTCMLVRPPAGYATGNKPNIREGLYLPPQALPLLARVIERSSAEPIVVDLEVNRWNLREFLRSFATVAPDVVLFTVTTPSHCYCREMSRAIRRISPDTLIVFGGPHATYEWHYILSNGIADVVIFREGEFGLAGLLKSLIHSEPLSQCRGIAYVDSQGVPRRTPDCADADPFATFGMPGYEYTDMAAYKDRVGKCTLEIARGCPHGCNFCLNTKYYRLRYKPMSNVLAELDVLIRRYKFEKISIISPELMADRAYMSILLDRLASTLEGTGVTWACATSAMSLSRALLGQMARAHCRSIFIGIESGADDVHCVFGSKLKLAALEEHLVAIGDAGIGILASFIIGLPGESEASACRSIDLALRLREKFRFIKTIQFNTFGPFPGTDFGDDMARYGSRLLPIDYAYYPVVPAVESNTFSREAHYKLWHRVWQEFFPDYYDAYLPIEAAALAGQNPRLAAFCSG